MGKKKEEEKKRKCFLYTRVSTGMQVEGYSLEAQEEKLRKYADLRDMEVVEPVFSDRGKSGKNTKHRDQFTAMMNQIKGGADVDYVLVFKLSRFGRNAADVLTAVQEMQNCGVELAITEDNIDTAKQQDKLMLTILSGVAEVERENIIEQTMAGREQKAREGKWNGGFAPYGYKLVQGELKIEKKEAELIRLIYDLYMKDGWGVNTVTKYLNRNGYTKKTRQNGTLPYFETGFIRGVLDNPIYAGKIAFGRRRTERKKNGECNETHVVKQEEFNVYEGIHDAIISEELWQSTQEKRKTTGGRNDQVYNRGRVHLLTGMLVCPKCGRNMYSNVSRKKKPDGTIYKDIFYYQCKEKSPEKGGSCDYEKNWNQEQLNREFTEILVKVINDDILAEAIESWFGPPRDDSEIRKDIEKHETEVNNLRKRIRKIGQQQDALDVEDELYDDKFDELQMRIDKLYEEIKNHTAELGELEQRLDEEQVEIMQRNRMTTQEMMEAYKALLPTGLTEIQDKELIRSIVDTIEIYPERQENGRLIKAIHFKVRVEYEGQEGDILTWKTDKNEGEHVECIVLMSATFCKENR